MDPSDQRFTADSAIVDNTLCDMPDHTPFSVHLDPEDCPHKVDDEFLCPICLMVVQNPQQCAKPKCEILICHKCISQWLTFKPDCPNCRQPFVANAVHRYMLKQIQALKFDCALCSDQYTYSEAHAHL